MKEYLRQHLNASKHRQRNKGGGKIQKRGAKFNTKTWAHFNKAWAIGKKKVANLLCQSENLGNKIKHRRNQHSSTQLKIWRQPKL